MTPPQAPQDRRWTDVSRLTFTPSVVVAIVATSITISGAMWASNAGLRSDVRDILTRMEGQVQVQQLNMEIQKQSAETLTEAIESIRRRVELQGYEIQALKEMQLKGRTQ